MNTECREKMNKAQIKKAWEIFQRRPLFVKEGECTLSELRQNKAADEILDRNGFTLRVEYDSLNNSRLTWIDPNGGKLFLDSDAIMMRLTRHPDDIFKDKPVFGMRRMRATEWESTWFWQNGHPHVVWCGMMLGITHDGASHS